MSVKSKSSTKPGKKPPKQPSSTTAPQPEQSQPGQSPPGLDQAKHARALRAAQGAELLREGIFPALMASALGFDKFVETSAFKLFVDRFLADLGNPKDPIERMLAQQMALLHFRIAQVQVDASQAKSGEVLKILNSATARLLGEFRRGAVTLRALQTPPTAEGRSTKVRLYKMAK